MFRIISILCFISFTAACFSVCLNSLFDRFTFNGKVNIDMWRCLSTHTAKWTELIISITNQAYRFDPRQKSNHIHIEINFFPSCFYSILEMIHWEREHSNAIRIILFAGLSRHRTENVIKIQTRIMSRWTTTKWQKMSRFFFLCRKKNYCHQSDYSSCDTSKRMMQSDLSINI